MSQVYMLDTNTCSFIMREHPHHVLERMQACVNARGVIVISAITYSEMRYGSIGPKASARHAGMITSFVKRLDGILPWDSAAVDATVQIRLELRSLGTPIGNNDAAIAGHAIAAKCILVTNNTREFSRVPGLVVEDWV